MMDKRASLSLVGFALLMGLVVWPLFVLPWKQTCVVMDSYGGEDVYFCDPREAAWSIAAAYWVAMGVPLLCWGGALRLPSKWIGFKVVQLGCGYFLCQYITTNVVVLALPSLLSLEFVLGSLLVVGDGGDEWIMWTGLVLGVFALGHWDRVCLGLLALSIPWSLRISHRFAHDDNGLLELVLLGASLVHVYSNPAVHAITAWLGDFYCFFWVWPSFQNLQLLLNQPANAIPKLCNPLANGFRLTYLVLVRHQPKAFAISMAHGWLYLTLMSFVDPIAMHLLLSSQPGVTTLRRDLILALVLTGSMLVRVSCMEVCFFYSVKVMARSRTILQFNLLERLLLNGVDDEQTVLIPTLVSGDAERFGASSWVVFFLASWTFAVLSLPFTMWILTYLVGSGAALLAMGIMIFGGLASREIARWAQQGFEALNLKRDARSQAVLQCLNNMLQIKMFASEQTWRSKLDLARESEVAVWWRIRLAQSFSNSCSTLVQVSVATAVFAYVTLVEHKELDAAGAFATLLVLSQLSWSVGTLPDIFNLYSSLMPCANRLAAGFQLKRGELVVVTGPAGAGKSCLLRHLASSTSAAGAATVRKVYLGQTPFLFNGTIRENICLGELGEEGGNDGEQAFCAAIQLAQLERDLAALPQGYNTMVGDGGVQLSGGQRTRIALARALYCRKQVDLFLVDDLFASVDVNTGRRIFVQCICNALLRQGKCVVLASSYCNEEVMAASSKAIDIRNGKCLVTLFSPLLCQDDDGDDGSSEQAAVFATTPSAQLHDQREEEDNPQVQRNILYKDFAEYWSRLRVFPGSRWWLVGFVLALALLEFASPYWLAHWTQHTSEHGLEIFALIQILFVGFSQVVYLFTTRLALSASRSVHEQVLNVLFRSPMSLFDSTSHGKIAQMLMGDLRNLDESLPDSAVSQLKRGVVALFQLGTITRFAPVVLFVLPLLVLAYRWILNAVRLPSLGIKRMEAQSHGPVLASFLDAVRGRFTLTESFGLRQGFVHMVSKRLALAEQTRVGSEAVSKFAQALAVQSGCALFLAVSTTGVFALHRSELSDAKLGLILTFAGMLQRTGMDLMMGWTSFETNLVSVERLAGLMRGPVEEEKQEAAGEAREAGPALVEFEQVTLRYRMDRPLVLQGASFVIQPGSKVCIVGRTGEGKSSLFLALLRLYAIENGRILINGVDISLLPLRTLRQERCRVILQDCKLTERTLRGNLLFGSSNEYTDLELRSVLERVGFSTRHFELDQDVTSSGGSGGYLLSAGERQLVCIARALLGTPPALLLCDECTSFLNDELDRRVHSELLLNMPNTTLLAICHRQSQLDRFDHRLVIERGRVIEYM
ncbi:hypothetical protein BASA81_005559 [Batrachochytrium salamandrivorans]|nr:hypothetical protein BASA81_005559 [Batrachochytrium salamandrivorans]